MCGFVGVYRRDGAPVDPAVLDRMRSLQAHRGPDDQGLRMFSLERGASHDLGRGATLDDTARFEGGVGFNRLSILDLSEHGHQPMASGDGSVFIAFNGEVYNAPEQRPELQSRGHRFVSHTDTEVLLQLYMTHGFAGMLERLNGMFAICIVDLRRGEIHLARDRLGIKPLYWARCDEAILFTSEVKSLLAWPGFSPRLDESLVDETLAYRFCAQAGHLLQGVSQILPGQHRCITRDRIVDRQYWSIPDGGDCPAPTYEEALAGLEEHIERSVRLRLLSDVKLGCQLSGGIDSSVVTVFARKHFAADMDTLSVTFDDPRFSEDEWITRAAVAAHADSHRFPLTSEYVIEHLPDAAWHLDQPINLPNSVGIYFLARKSRPLVTVLLSGEGADELMGGYHRFLYAATRSRVRPWLPLLQRVPRLGRTLRA